MEHGSLKSGLLIATKKEAHGNTIYDATSTLSVTLYFDATRCRSFALTRHEVDYHQVDSKCKYGLPLAKMKYRIKTLCLFVVFSILTPVAPTVPVLATPTISASPAIGVSGTIVKVSGSEFGSFAGDQLELYFDDTLIKPDSGPISGAVYFQTTFVVPDSARSGYHFISIKGITGTVLAQKQFYVPEQEITLNVWSGTIGTTVKLSVRVFTQGKM